MKSVFLAVTLLISSTLFAKKPNFTVEDAIKSASEGKEPEQNAIYMQHFLKKFIEFANQKQIDSSKKRLAFFMGVIATLNLAEIAAWDVEAEHRSVGVQRQALAWPLATYSNEKVASDLMVKFDYKETQEIRNFANKIENDIEDLASKEIIANSSALNALKDEIRNLSQALICQWKALSYLYDHFDNFLETSYAFFLAQIPDEMETNPFNGLKSWNDFSTTYYDTKSRENIFLSYLKIFDAMFLPIEKAAVLFSLGTLDAYSPISKLSPKIVFMILSKLVELSPKTQEDL